MRTSNRNESHTVGIKKKIPNLYRPLFSPRIVYDSMGKRSRDQGRVSGRGPRERERAEFEVKRK